MKTLKDFTPEIKAKIPQYIKKYTEGIFDGGRYNSFKKENAEKLIDWNYAKCGYKLPVVLVAENIYEAQIFFNHIKANEKIYTPILYLIYCLRNKIKLPELRGQLDEQLYEQLRGQLDGQLDGQLYGQLRGQLDGQLYGQLDGQLRGQLDGQLLYKYNNSYLFTSNIYSNVNLAWYKFIKDEFKIDTQIGVKLDSWNDLYMQSGIYSAIFSELLCIVSKYPKKVNRDQNKNLHSTTNHAVEWGYSTDLTKMDCYYIHGRNISSENYLLALENKITKDIWLKEKNEDTKAAWFEILGPEKVMEILGAEQIDSNMTLHANGDLEEHILYKTPFILKEIGEALAWVKFICPSTGSTYLISVNPKHTNVKDAVLESCPFYGEEIKQIEDYSFSARG